MAWEHWKKLPELLEKSGSKKMMIVSDHGLEQLGVVKKIQDIGRGHDLRD